MNHANTIHLSNTVDHYARHIHVNVRNDKVTLVLRWKDKDSLKAHTQRTTLSDTQVGQLLGALTSASFAAICSNEGTMEQRWATIMKASQ